MLALCVTLYLSSVRAQWLTSAHATSERTCPLNEFRARVSGLDSACCDSSTCGQINATGVPLQCRAMCAAVLADMRADCDVTFSSVFDGIDGEEDDSALAVTDLQTLCDSVPVTSIFVEMGRLQDTHCDLFDADGVGELVVTDATNSSGCVDTGPASRCALVVDGTLTCEEDFCRDCPGKHAGECDRTCAFCQVSKHNRHHRQMQIDITSPDICSALNLQTQVEPVNDACCDAGRASTCNGGSAGVPTVCDARCGIAYLPFFEKCETVLRESFGAVPQTVNAFVNLAQTCRQLPRQQLLGSLSLASSCGNSTGYPTGYGQWMDMSSDCSLDVFQNKIGAVDAACCSSKVNGTSKSDGTSRDCNGRAPQTCTPREGAPASSPLQSSRDCWPVCVDI